ncbi:hypothetical protein DRV85_08830 [Rhodosalinus halophilus]|uniref:Methyltransferase n=1 Tax=Rhodosalinus halophilus TaxID=2259333 RepID=A0A365UA25_9RHOB|nr:DNA methyltransferase [Rhodosalinus halophilus]RBI85814.1 hypothetical protein DRV85_08830 [Rhodosalinus halophilus]
MRAEPAETSQATKSYTTSWDTSGTLLNRTGQKSTLTRRNSLSRKREPSSSEPRQPRTQLTPPSTAACWCAVRGKGHWSGDRKPSTLWQIPGRDEDAATVHGTQKPVECMRRPMLNNSSPGQAVYEPFAGSGSTLIAAETTGRACQAIELDPAYVDVAVRRWEAFTGETALLEGDGRSFAELARERQEVPA